MKKTDKAKHVRVALLALAATLTVSAFGEVAPQRMRRRQSQPSGGLAYTSATAKHIAVVNAQKTVTPAELQKAIDAVIIHLHMPFSVVSVEKAEDLGDAIRREKSDDKVGAVLVFEEGAGAEKGWVWKDPVSGVYRVNVSVLAKDAERDVLEARVRKMVWRSLAWTLDIEAGGGKMSILSPAKTLAELDAISATTPGPLQHNAMVDRLEKRGVKMVKVGTYRQACQEGWAPAPKNDEQKAIWNQVHAIPDKPIKIEFDPKKDK